MSQTFRQRTRIGLTALACIAAVTVATPAGNALAAGRPVKELVETHIGREVNKTTKENVCVVSSGDECRAGLLGKEAGGFEYPLGVASGAVAKRLYVADRSNGRIQVFTLQGAFVSEFGTGQLAEPMSITVDQSSGDVYVLDWAHHRVVKYTANGEFILMIGGEVNETEDNTIGATEAQKNLCTSEEVKNIGVKCKIGVESVVGAKSHGAFKPPRERGDLLAVGPGGVLYVGDEGRIQEFEAGGQYKEDVPVAGTVEALAVDGGGEVYLIDEEPARTIRKLTAAGVEVKDGHWPLTLTLREANGFFLALLGLAVDPAGRVATTGFEEIKATPPNSEPRTRSFGLLLDGGSAEQITEFQTGIPSTGLAFGVSEVGTSGGYEMYAAAEDEQQVLAYRPVSVGELVLNPAVCVPGVERETDVTFNCTLNGEVNPWGVSSTEIWFEWGQTTALGARTPTQSVCTASCPSNPSSVSALLEGLRPDENTLNDQLAGYDQSVQPPEVALKSKEVSFRTPTVPPKISGGPSVSFVHASSAVLFGELNPENAQTQYSFEYGPCETVCATSPYPFKTTVQEASTYGLIGTTAEATGLQPLTEYHYRLSAVNEKAETAVQNPEGEGVFTTAPALKVIAETGPPSAISTTSAVVSGSVNPDGKGAAYSFELGFYTGPGTQYGIVFSGPVTATTTTVPESLGLTGLQPGTTYAYRIIIKSGYGESVGVAQTFTTSGLPSALLSPPALQMLAIPNIAFPTEPVRVTTKKLTRAQRLAKALKACTKKPGSKRVACRRSARNKYAASGARTKRK